MPVGQHKQQGIFLFIIEQQTQFIFTPGCEVPRTIFFPQTYLPSRQDNGRTIKYIKNP